MLQLQNLVVSYGKETREDAVLKRVNLELLDKEKAVIVGPNGSGKSTLFKAILGLVRIKEGSAVVFGNDVGKESGDVRVSANLAEVYRLAYVPARDIVNIFAELKGGNPETAFKMFHEFELDSILKKRIHELSTGQQKMFGNILALSFSPKLVLLDEPFDNVDENRRRRLVDVLKSYDSEIVIITHEFNLLPRLGDWNLYFMLEGKLWGKFFVSQLDRLYITRGEVKDALKIMETSLGKLSVTLDHGDIQVKTASNVNALLERV
jgi:ABC-type multidrug transport system ATPase subunit